MVKTFFDIVKAHSGVPIAIGMKAETKEGEEELSLQTFCLLTA